MSKFNFDDVLQAAAEVPLSLKQRKLSILLPVYNESASIAQNIRFVAQSLRSWGWNFEILASDDGSRDNSWEAILSVQQDVPELVPVHSPRNFGKGRALASAFEASSGDFILFLDSDLELPVEHIPYFFRQMEADQADIVIGSKKDPRSDLFYPASRRLFSTAYFMGVKLLFGLPVQDTQTGIKLFRREALESSLPYLLVKRFAFDIELLVLCHTKGFKISSHPVVVRYIRDGIGRMGFQTILHMLKDTLAVFWRLRTGFWATLPQSKAGLSLAVLALGPAQSHGIPGFTLNSMDELPALLPQLKTFDLILFLHEGEEIAPFMVHSLNRLFADPKVQAAVPLMYNKHEQGIKAKRYYTLANAFYGRGVYARFRPVRSHALRVPITLSSCALRLSYLEEIMARGQDIQSLMVADPHCSPYFFIHSECSLADWRRACREAAPKHLPLGQAMIRRIPFYLSFSLFLRYLPILPLWFMVLFPLAYGLLVQGILFLNTMPQKFFAQMGVIPPIMAFLFGLLHWGAQPFGVVLVPLFPVVFFSALWLLMEAGLLFWFAFSLGLRRALPFYLFFSWQRFLAFSPLRSFALSYGENFAFFFKIPYT